MSIRRSSVIFIALGVLLIVAAAVVRFWVVPTVSKLPGSTDVTVTYEGTGTLLNPAALQSGDTANVMATDVPVTVDRHIYVSNTKGNTAITHDDFVVSAPGMEVKTDHTYALDRKSMEPAPAPEGTTVQEHTGITIGLPIHPDGDKSYTLYDFATQQDFPMQHQAGSTVKDRQVLNYTVAASGPLKDPAMLAALPPALPKAQLAGLAGLLPPEVRAEMTPDVLASLPDPVPFTYTADTQYGLAVDDTLGTPADGTIKQQVTANISVGGQTVPLLPVLAIDTALTDQSVADSADTASSTATKLTLMSLWVPLALLLVGIVLIAWGVLRRSKTTPPSSTHQNPTATTAHR